MLHPASVASRRDYRGVVDLYPATAASNGVAGLMEINRPPDRVSHRFTHGCAFIRRPGRAPFVNSTPANRRVAASRKKRTFPRALIQQSIPRVWQTRDPSFTDSIAEPSASAMIRIRQGWGCRGLASQPAKCMSCWRQFAMTSMVAASPRGALLGRGVAGAALTFLKKTPNRWVTR
jgi:hypothetical protein